MVVKRGLKSSPWFSPWFNRFAENVSQASPLVGSAAGRPQKFGMHSNAGKWVGAVLSSVLVQPESPLSTPSGAPNIY
jgi:hypothetical protein